MGKLVFWGGFGGKFKPYLMSEIPVLDNGLGNCITFGPASPLSEQTIRPCELRSRRRAASHGGKKLSSSSEGTDGRREGQQARFRKLEGGKNYPGCEPLPHQSSSPTTTTVILDYPQPDHLDTAGQCICKGDCWIHQYWMRK